jgi:NhaP-type Na+/H+ or K+/H+ antiporter
MLGMGDNGHPRYWASWVMTGGLEAEAQPDSGPEPEPASSLVTVWIAGVVAAVCSVSGLVVLAIALAMLGRKVCRSWKRQQASEKQK